MANLAQDLVRELFDYNEATGELIWKVSTAIRIKIGDVAGSLNKISGYYQVMINNKNYRLHRIIWLWQYGYTPTTLDHIDRDRTNNKIENLREVTVSENNQNKSLSSNNTSGYKGVNWDKREGKWRAKIQLNNKMKHLGYFDNLQDAINARKEGEKLYHTHAVK